MRAILLGGVLLGLGCGIAHAQAPYGSCGHSIPPGNLVIAGVKSNRTCLDNGGLPQNISPPFFKSIVSGATSNTAFSPTLPSPCGLIQVFVQETGNVNPIPGGITIGTSPGGSELFGGTSQGGPAVIGAGDEVNFNSIGFVLQQIGGDTMYLNSPNWGSPPGTLAAQAYCLE